MNVQALGAPAIIVCLLKTPSPAVLRLLRARVHSELFPTTTTVVRVVVSEVAMVFKLNV